MNKLITVILILFSVNSFSAQGPDCDKIKETRFKLAVAAQNIKSSTIASSSFYKPVRIESCANGTCETYKDETPLFTYLPDHPRANSQGYVKISKMKIKNEIADFNALALKLKLYGKKGICKSKLIGSGKAILIEYFGSNSASDVFNYDNNGKLTSWARGDGSGKSATINFDSNGVLKTYNSGMIF